MMSFIVPLSTLLLNKLWRAPKMSIVATFAAVLAAAATSHSLASAAVWPVSVNGSSLVAQTSPTYIAHGWEMWQMFNYLDKMSDPRYINAAKSLAGSLVRVGGITCDWTLYAGFEAGAPQDLVQPLPLSATGSLVPRGLDRSRAGFWPSAPQNFTLASFETLLGFFNASGLSLLFDLNEFLGRDCHTNKTGPCSYNCDEWCTGSWDTSNVRVFLQWIHDHKLVGFGPDFASPLIGFELGNELVTHLAPDANIADIAALAAIVAEIWADAPSLPPIYAPSTDSCSDVSAAAIMQAAAGEIAGFSYHACESRASRERARERGHCRAA